MAALALGALLPLIVSGCRATGDRGPAVVVRSGSGASVRVAVELVTTAESRRQGLMWRKELAPSSGMLFIFPKLAIQNFWMHNTPLALDIMYIEDSGRIARIYERTTPFSRAPLPSGVPVRFVLEVAGGFSAEHGVKVGDTVDLGRLASTPAS